MLPIAVVVLVLGTAILGLLFGVFAIVPYWSVERRGRPRWRAAPAPSPSEHPYRTRRAEKPRRAEPARAPALVRAAAMTSFLWAWACLAWAIAVLVDRRSDGHALQALVVLPPLAGAFFVQRAARRMLTRDEGTTRLTRPLVVAQAAHAAVLVMFGMIAEPAGADAAVAHLTTLLGIGALAQSVVVHFATRAHAAAFARG